jgi:hypothetical protein
MNVTDWLLDSDPAIRWQVMRDLTDAPADEVAAERARVANEGWGAELLALQDEDGRWDGGTYRPGWVDDDKPDEQGRWALENVHQGPTHLELEGPEDYPSRWNTLRALRVLRWARLRTHEEGS